MVQGLARGRKAGASVGRRMGKRLRVSFRSMDVGARHTSRRVSGHVSLVWHQGARWTGELILPPHRCPGCGGWRQRRHLAPCQGVVNQPSHRHAVFATGCPTCGLLYARPRPPASQLGAWYSASGAWAAQHAVDEAGRSRPIGGRLLDAVDALTGVRLSSEGGRALDVGCGHGRWLDALASSGWDTYGLDPAVKTAFPRHAELTRIPATRQFGFVVISHVLEHVPDPGGVLRTVSAAMLPGAWLYIAVPNLDRLPEHGDWFYVLNARAHMAAFSLDCLSTLLGRSGFGQVQIVVPRKESANGAKRLRVVAQLGGAPPKIVDPLDAALRAIEQVSSPRSGRPCPSRQ